MLLHSRASFKSGTVTVSAWIPGLGPLSCPAPLPCLAAVAPAAGTIHYGHWIAFAVIGHNDDTKRMPETGETHER